MDVAQIFKSPTVNKWLLMGADIDLIGHAVGRLNAVLNISEAPEVCREGIAFGGSRSCKRHCVGVPPLLIAGES
jgi:hypothetical protein